MSSVSTIKVSLIEEVFSKVFSMEEVSSMGKNKWMKIIVRQIVKVGCSASFDIDRLTI